VFNGALKTNLTLNAKQSVIEDGLMIQIDTDMMSKLKQSLQTMKPLRIECSQLTPGESVITIEWSKENRHINKYVRSPIDMRSMTGVKSIRLANAYDYVNENKSIRWNEIFLIKMFDESNSLEDSSFNLNRFADMVSQATCTALAPLLADLTILNESFVLSRCHFEMGRRTKMKAATDSTAAAQDNNNNHVHERAAGALAAGRPFRVALRVEINSDNVGYLFGMNGEPIGEAKFLASLDNELIQLLHQANSYNVNLAIEFIFTVQERFNCGGGMNVKTTNPHTLMPK
jgi:hypothetical protein